MKVFLRCSCGTRDTRARGCAHKWASQFKYKGAVIPLQTPFTNKADAVADALRQRATWIKRATGQPVDDEDVTGQGRRLGEVRADYLQDCIGRITPQTLTTYTRILALFVDIVGATTLIHTLTPFDLNRWRSARLDGVGGRRPVSRATVNSELAAVQGLFTFAGVSHRLFGAFVTLNGAKVPGILRWPAQKHARKHRPLTREELACAWQRLPDPFDLITRVTYETLARLSEVLFLRRQDVGTSRGADGHPSGWIIRQLKGGQTRRSALPLDLARVLMARRADPAALLFHELLRPGQTRLAQMRYVSRAYRRLFDQLGLRCSHHTFKHTGITTMLDRGESDLAITQHAGWTSPKMLPTYGHVNDASARRAVDGNAREAAAILAGVRRDPLVIRRRRAGSRNVGGSTQGKQRRVGP
jgi:integrase